MRGCFENILGMVGCGQRTVFSIRITEESGSPWPLPRTRKNASTNESQRRAEAHGRYHARGKTPVPTNHRAREKTPPPTNHRTQRKPVPVTTNAKKTPPHANHRAHRNPMPVTTHAKNAPANKWKPVTTHAAHIRNLQNDVKK